MFARRGSRIGWRESYGISLAGVAASRVFGTAGAGGIALNVWALARSGMHRRLLVSRLTSFYVLLYGIFMAALVLVGTGLRTGVLDGPVPFGLTVVPAIFDGVAILGALAAAGLRRTVRRVGLRELRPRRRPDPLRSARASALLARRAARHAQLRDGAFGPLSWRR